MGQITIDKGLGNRQLGVRTLPVKSAEGTSKEGLKVTLVKLDGAVGTWNAFNPGSEVRVNDVFVDINGVCNDAAKMYDEIAADAAKLRIRICRTIGRWQCEVGADLARDPELNGIGC